VTTAGTRAITDCDGCILYPC